MAQEAAQLDHLAIDRARMVERQIARRGVSDARVLDAMRQVPREAFVAPGFEEFAYEDSPLPIAEGQTISQPYIVALMIEAAEVKPGDWVLEVGTGSGYAAAVLSRIAARSTRSSGMARWRKPPNAASPGLAIAISRSATATAPWAGPRSRRSMPSL
jgi:protein-L-isoaspartate(D-aspartate) O-methyltransferase